MKLRVSPKSVSGAALALSLVWGAPVQAQTTAANSGEASGESEITPPDENQIQDIVVTATRREESLSRVGVTVTAVGADELANRGISSPDDLVKVVPGFQAAPTFGGAPNYTLRGVGFAARYASAISPVGLYLDEGAVPYPYMSLGLLFDLERVEVLKGPQGTLYGRNATGGLINFVSAKPTATAQGGMMIEAGSYETLNVSTFVSGPLSDGVRVRLALDTQNRFKGYQKSVTRNERLGELNQHAARLSIALGNGGPLSIDLQGNYWKKDGDTQAPQATGFTTFINQALITPAMRASIIAKPTSNKQADFLSSTRQPSADVGIIHPAPLVDSEFYMGTARVAYELSDALTLASLTSYSNLKQREVTDAAGLQTESIYQDSQTDIDSFSEEIRLLGDIGDLNFSIGGYYANDNARAFELGYADENTVITGLRGAALFLNPLTGNRYTAAQIRRGFINYQNRIKFDTEVLAGFANFDYRLSDQFKVTLGGRYTRDKVGFEGCTYDTNGGNVPVINPVYTALFGAFFDLQPGQCYVLNETNTAFVPIVQRSQKQNNFAWRANVDFTPNSDTLLYATISRGFKAGGFPVLAASSINQFTAIRQEKLTNYELGAKLRLFDRRVQWNTSIFYYDYKDKQVFGRTPDLVFRTLSRIDNIPESHEYGIETDFTARLTDGLTARLAGVYIKSKIDKYNGFTEAGTPSDFAGRPFAFTPKFQGNASLNYEGPVSDTLDFYASVSGSYQSRSHADFDGAPEFVIKDYGLVDATLGVSSQDGEWRAGLYAKNLFDTYYWTSVSSATETVFRYAGMPREIGARVSFKF